jgi:acetyl-CoA carboxylase biotin carboxyl carrier protein
MLPDQKEITYSLSYKEILEILKLIDESPCQELRLELEGFKLEIIKGTGHLPSSGGVAPGPPLAAPPSAALPEAVKPREDQSPKSGNKETAPAPSASGAPIAGEAATASGVQVKTPLTGTFYRAPAPGAKPFVEVGAAVDAGEQVGIVEVMKLMNSIKSPVKGIVRQILAENETMVKMGQTLMIIEPA